MFTKKDFYFSIFTGAGAGLIAWRIFNFLGFPGLVMATEGAVILSSIWLILIVPILWVVGVNLGYFLGRYVGFFSQFGKFAAIGFTNAAVDFGVLNYLISLSGITGGGYYSIFKTTSFLVALINSYLLNKYWAFEAGRSSGGGIEFVKFASVAVVALLVNVGVASYIVNSVSPMFGFTSEVWANVGAIVGSASALILSFTGFKLLVFKTKIDAVSN